MTDILDQVTLARTTSLLERIYDADIDDEITIEAAWKMILAEARRHPLWPGKPSEPLAPMAPPEKVDPFKGVPR